MAVTLVFQAVMLDTAFSLSASCSRHHHLAGHLLVLHQIMDQQQDDVVRVDELAAPVVQANAVRIAIGGQAAVGCRPF
jgi:hypothetical protein